MKQFTGIVGTKHLLKWIFPRLVELCDPCSEKHDAAYNQRNPRAWNYIHWKRGASATAHADNRWLTCSLKAVGADEKLIRQVKLGYKAIRAWGKARAWAWKYLYLRY